MSRRADSIRAYHESFQGDTYDACKRCGGRCERYKTSTLVPGEAAYLAAHLGMSVAELRRRYLDRIDTPYGRVDVIRLRSACPFLSADKRCTVIEAKPILCDCYPIIVAPSRGRPRFVVDRRDCPMARQARHRSCVAEFVAESVPALKRLRLPLSWRRAAALYDEFDFDHARIERHLKQSASHEAVMVEELLAFACNGYESRARRRGLRLLSLRLSGAMQHAVELRSVLARRGGPRALRAARGAASLRASGRELLRRLSDARRDSTLLEEPAGGRYRRLTRETKNALRKMERDASRSARLLDHAPLGRTAAMRRESVPPPRRANRSRARRRTASRSSR
jgi:Fe-S-cluster containining protein